MLHAHLLHSAHLVRFAPPVIELRPQPEAPRDLAPKLATLLTEATGTRWTIALSTAPGEPTLAEQGNAADAARRATAADHPLVRAILDAFPGARIDSVHDATADAYGLPAGRPPPRRSTRTTPTCRSSPRPTQTFPKTWSQTHEEPRRPDEAGAADAGQDAGDAGQAGDHGDRPANPAPAWCASR